MQQEFLLLYALSCCYMGLVCSKLLSSQTNLRHQSNIIVSEIGVMSTCYACCCGCRRGEDPVIAAIEERIAEWTRLPPDHGEPIQVGAGSQADISCAGSALCVLCSRVISRVVQALAAGCHILPSGAAPDSANWGRQLAGPLPAA